MTISEDSQLGLRFLKNKEVKVKCLRLIEKYLTEGKEVAIKKLEKAKEDFARLKDEAMLAAEGLGEDERESFLKQFDDNESYKIQPSNFLFQDENHLGTFPTVEQMFVYGVAAKQEIKFFLIQNSVFKAAELIKIGENFTGRTLKDIKHGDYIYLLGKYMMIKFHVNQRGIKGFYWDELKEKVFEWGIEMETGEYFYHAEFQNEFSQIMQILTFIELGDIEVKYLPGLHKIKAPKKEDSIYNGSNNNVYVVDSTWNQILIRTEGFAVRGHFKLQVCGPGGADRKLIWINSYEKDGYTRRPKATIAR